MLGEKKENKSIINSILGLITFSTIIPINVNTSIQSMAKITWVWPFINLINGILGAAIGFICLKLLHFDPLLSSILTFTFIMIFSGFNHMDGLIDMCDGLMAHGTPREKYMIMKDSFVGTGGIMGAILISLITIGCYNYLLTNNLFFGIIIVEMLSKTSLLATALVSTPLRKGIGKYFIESINFLNFIISTIIVIIIAYFLCHFPGIFATIGAVFAGGLIAWISKKHFIAANGDVLGASCEIGRSIALIFMIIAIILL